MYLYIDRTVKLARIPIFRFTSRTVVVSRNLGYFLQSGKTGRAGSVAMNIHFADTTPIFDLVVDGGDGRV